MNAVADRLRKAKTLIERGWCRDDYARGKSGRKVDPTSRSAVCFCAVGALGAVNKHWPHGGMIGLRELNSAIGCVGCGEYPVLTFNDSHNQAEVLAAFDKAIELASGTEAGTGETEGLDPKGDGPVPKADAQ